MSCGIYMMNCVLDATAMYIGQSRNIEERIKEHYNHRNNPQTFIDNAIAYYGMENFTYTILEECSEDMLDEREDYYIRLYQTNKCGYNRIRGGQHNNGESNPKVKLSEQDVYDIRESYKNHLRKRDVYAKYSDRMTWYSFSNLWEGTSWQNIHMDVYTEENKRYYSSEATNGGASEFASFTDEEVLELRKRYMTESAKEIYESVSDRCKLQTLQQILFGRRYKNVPIYDKKNDKWIN